MTTTARTRIAAAVLTATTAASIGLAGIATTQAHRAADTAAATLADVEDVRVRVGSGGQEAMHRVAAPAEPGGFSPAVATVRLDDLIDTPVPGAVGFNSSSTVAPGWHRHTCLDGWELHPDLRPYTATPRDKSHFVYSTFLDVDADGDRMCVPVTE